MKNKNIRITQTQLNILMEQNINNDYHVDGNGDLQSGEMETPEPYQMAEKVADFLINGDSPLLHPEFYKNEELYMEFVNALHDVLTQKMQSGEASSHDNENPFDMSQSQMNESKEELKKTFKRFL